MQHAKIGALVVLVLAVLAPQVQGQEWRLALAEPADSVLRQIMDTAYVEPAMCLVVDVDSTAREVFVWQVLPAVVVGRRQTRDMITFQCPRGTAFAHGHFVARGHVDGPSDGDRQALERLRPEARPPAAVVVVVDRTRRNVHYMLYGMR